MKFCFPVYFENPNSLLTAKMTVSKMTMTITSLWPEVLLLPTHSVNAPRKYDIGHHGEVSFKFCSGQWKYS